MKQLPDDLPAPESVEKPPEESMCATKKDARDIKEQLDKLMKMLEEK